MLAQSHNTFIICPLFPFFLHKYKPTWNVWLGPFFLITVFYNYMFFFIETIRFFCCHFHILYYYFLILFFFFKRIIIILPFLGLSLCCHCNRTFFIFFQKVGGGHPIMNPFYQIKCISYVIKMLFYQVKLLLQIQPPPRPRLIIFINIQSFRLDLVFKF